MILKHEEKETDVAIAVKLFEVCHLNEADIVVVITGDTDLSPAIKQCNIIFPNKKILFAFPYDRKNKELLKLSPDSFSIRKKQYIKHLFPNFLKTGSGDQIFKPDSW